MCDLLFKLILLFFYQLSWNIVICLFSNFMKTFSIWVWKIRVKNSNFWKKVNSCKKSAKKPSFSSHVRFCDWKAWATWAGARGNLTAGTNNGSEGWTLHQMNFQQEHLCELRSDRSLSSLLNRNWHKGLFSFHFPCTSLSNILRFKTKWSTLNQWPWILVKFVELMPIWNNLI